MPTLDSIVVDTRRHKISKKIEKAGDGTVSRTSALSERKHRNAAEVYRLIDWDSETFLSTDHLGLTRDRTFVDNVLNRLLSEQVNDTFRDGNSYQQPQFTPDYSGFEREYVPAEMTPGYSELGGEYGPVEMAH